MSFLRSSCIATILSLFVLTGYGYGIVADCSNDHRNGHAEHQDSAPGGDCHCVCHMIAMPETAAPALLGEAMLAECGLANVDDFPPDAVPLGIEYPPQLS